MPTLIKPPTTEQPEVTATSRSNKLLPISMLFGCILIIVASLNYVTKADEEELEALQAKLDKREPLKDYEKEAYCDLLWKVKQIQLCACKKNFIKDIGSLTGYTVQKTDLDWRGSGKTFEEALEEAFRRTGIPKERFVAKKWAKDINGKSGVVEWKGPRSSEISVDAPHEIDGPDVFHIGFKALDLDDQKIKGHIFLDCVPYFRGKKKEDD
ncbi:MAG TPA: polymorphic toxin type 47 domain-containing protein [Leptospiraceae bacterium]|nr:polymorphic toxin type 47 domain-containing protein [Leptospiraceae bacterium]HMX31566.1 polymorphic toxin type 47 domain-containing protein [Leptospiraceae bacterium]HMY29647.1 polymorphic toxin type 47 domain-containing protein [Leptospiraceae bacterium]HMZ66568.1 polymorphic toxin type 47 domain-containing protein [Leptospiraceae bacterium]HNA09135.1 polymorphic toxin type 47 domain-containing protein [Leptospiraceae bacterium]